LSNYIKLYTLIPNKQDVKEYEMFNKFEARSMHGQLPVIWDSAKDFLVYDRHGNRFIDFTSGICVANVGHGNKEILDSIDYCLKKPILHSYTFPTEVRFAFLKELIETCYPEGKAFLVSAGTEATEVAIKLMRMYGVKTNRKRICSFEGAMHGRTLLAEQLKGNEEEWIDNSDYIEQLIFPENNEEFSSSLISPDVCGIIIETYQGWTAQFYPKQYIQDLVKWAKENDILVCFDEIQSGLGRTGKLWAWEHYEIEKPDLICFGKGISSSVPLSGVVGRADLLDLPEVGSMSSTHSANPISCATGLANLFELRDRNLIEEAERKGKIIENELHNTQYTINCKGLVAAILTATEEEATRIVWECFKKGLLTIWTHKNSIKLAPPLSIKDEALMEGLQIIKEILNG
jgi:4-aminobutyrate aminotransferase-like enzyme